MIRVERVIPNEKDMASGARLLKKIKDFLSGVSQFKQMKDLREIWRNAERIE